MQKNFLSTYFEILVLTLVFLSAIFFLKSKAAKSLRKYLYYVQLKNFIFFLLKYAFHPGQQKLI